MIGGCKSDVKVTSENCSITVIYEYSPGLGYKGVPEGKYLNHDKGYWIMLGDVVDQASLNFQ